MGTDRDLVDQDLKGALDVLPDLSTLSLATLAEVRALLALRPSPRTCGAERGAVQVPSDGAQPAVSGLLYRPRGTALRAAILHLHGGGMVAGTAARDDAAMRKLALALDAVILSIDYRLAPEAPFPAAMGRLHGGAHLAARAGGPARRRSGPDSAARGERRRRLAAGLALLARDRGGPAIAFLALTFPMLDDRTSTHPYAGRYVWPPAANRFGWDCYLSGIDPCRSTPRRAAPSSWADPPTFIAPARSTCSWTRISASRRADRGRRADRAACLSGRLSWLLAGRAGARVAAVRAGSARRAAAGADAVAVIES
jgi:triacylglycerol lipase